MKRGKYGGRPEAYNEYAAEHPVPNKIGHTICLSGLTGFVRINRGKKGNPGCVLITTPPVKDYSFSTCDGSDSISQHKS